MAIRTPRLFRAEARTSRVARASGPFARSWRGRLAVMAGVISSLLAGCGAGSGVPFAIGPQSMLQQSLAARSQEVTNRLIVKLGSQTSAQRVASSIGAEAVDSFSALGLTVLSLPGGMDPEAAMARLAGVSGVDYAEPDYRLKADLVPNDPAIGQQWGLKAIDAYDAWNYTTGANVVVAVVDTGIDIHHPEFNPPGRPSELLPGKSFVPGTDGPIDDNGHGTHVAGIIAAAMNDGIGTVGVAPGVKILPVKVLDANGQGDTSTIVAGLLYAADSGARIINLSLGGTGGGQALQDAISYVQAKGCLVVAAMGNDGENIQDFPAAYPGVVAVGATSEDGTIASFSNYGGWISVSAPGDGIYSTMPDYNVTLTSEEGGGLGYGYLSGTSMATPFVSGVAALVASAYPHMPAAWIKKRIEQSTTPMTPLGFDEFFGHGLVNAYRAVRGD